MASFESRIDDRRKAFKKGVDGDDARRRREDEALSLRKQKKDEQLQKKRMMLDPSQENGENACPNQQFAKHPAFDVEGMADLRVQLQAPTITPEQRLEVVTDIRKRLSRASNPPTQEAVDAGLIPLMVQYLQTDELKLQFEAAWVLTNIASGDSEQTEQVVRQGAVPALAQCLVAPDLDLREQAAWCVGNILGDSPQLRDHALSFNLLPSMLQLIVLAEQSGANKVSALRNATWALSNVFRGKPGPPIEVVQPAIPYVAQLMHHADAEVKTDTLWACSYLCDGGDDRIDALLAAQALPHLVAHLGHDDVKVVQPALRAVGNIAAGKDRHTSAVLQCGVLAQMPQLLQRVKPVIRKEAMWLLSNVTAGTSEQIQACIDHGLFPVVVEKANSDVTDVRKEALWTVSNAAVGSSAAQLEQIANAGAVECLVEALKPSTDTQVLVAVLDGLKACLQQGRRLEDAGLTNPFTTRVEEADGLCKLENLQEDKNEEIYTKAVELLTTFFDVEDEVDEAVAASASGAPQCFNFA